MMTTASSAPADAAVLTAVIAASASLAVALLTALFTRRAFTHARRLESSDRARQYREPLLHAAFNLQSRIWNIFRQGFLDDFLTQGSERDKQYARLNTVYLVGQYLCWAEIIRSEAQFLAPGSRRRERQLIIAMEKIRYLFADSQSLGSLPFRIFRGDQRAIGEIMTATSISASSPQRRCIGYAEYVNTILTNDNFSSWLQPLISELDRVAADIGGQGSRLKELQNCLVDLVNIIDPRGDRVSKDERTKVQ